MSLLTLRGVDASYGDRPVLRSVDLRVEIGEVVVILGANGAGKTSLIRAISGTIRRKGHIDFAGTRIDRLAPEAIVRTGLAQVPQGRGTITDLTVEENLRAGAFIRKDKAGVEEDLDRWFNAFPKLKERRRQVAGLLSGGEQQMLAVSRAMMSRPRLLLCDEPSLGLSPLLTQELFDSLAVINKESAMAILVVEQNARMALSIASRGYLLTVGDLAESRPASELMNDDAIRASYLGA